MERPPSQIAGWEPGGGTFHVKLCSRHGWRPAGQPSAPRNVPDPALTATPEPVSNPQSYPQRYPPLFPRCLGAQPQACTRGHPQILDAIPVSQVLQKTRQRTAAEGIVAKRTSGGPQADPRSAGPRTAMQTEANEPARPSHQSANHLGGPSPPGRWVRPRRPTVAHDGQYASMELAGGARRRGGCGCPFRARRLQSRSKAVAERDCQVTKSRGGTEGPLVPEAGPQLETSQGVRPVCGHTHCLRDPNRRMHIRRSTAMGSGAGQSRQVLGSGPALHPTFCSWVRRPPSDEQRAVCAASRLLKVMPSGGREQSRREREGFRGAARPSRACRSHRRTVLVRDSPTPRSTRLRGGSGLRCFT